MKHSVITAVLVMLITVIIAVPVYAQYTDGLTVIRDPESGQRDENGFPALSDSTAAEWIDRIADLPDYAKAFYRWLVKEAHADGALSDTSKGERITLSDGSDAYIHSTSLSGEFSFEIPDSIMPGEYDAYISRTVSEKIPYIMDENFNSAARALVTAENAFDRDHPEVFWLNGACSWNTRTVVTSVRRINSTVYVCYSQSVDYYLSCRYFDIRAEEYRDPGVISEAIAVRDMAADAIVSSIPEGADAEETLEYFNEWLIMHNGYNTSDDLVNLPSDTRECISALTGRSGESGPVCEGYARAFKVLCDLAMIPCVLADGYGQNTLTSAQVLHIWNLVKIGGDDSDPWYAVDVTWNDPLINGGADTVTGHESKKWFLVGGLDVINGMEFNESHILRNQVMDPGVCFLNGPALSDVSYADRD